MPFIMHAPLEGYTDWFPMGICENCRGQVLEQGRVLWNAQPEPSVANILLACSELCETAIRAAIAPVTLWGSNPIAPWIVAAAFAMNVGGFALRIGQSMQVDLMVADVPGLGQLGHQEATHDDE